MEFKQALKGALEYRGLSASDLGHRTGFSRQLISNYLHGKSDPAERVVAIATALDMSIDALVTGDYTSGNLSEFIEEVVYTCLYENKIRLPYDKYREVVRLYVQKYASTNIDRKELIDVINTSLKVSRAVS